MARPIDLVACPSWLHKNLLGFIKHVEARIPYGRHLQRPLVVVVISKNPLPRGGESRSFAGKSTVLATWRREARGRSIQPTAPRCPPAWQVGARVGVRLQADPCCPHLTTQEFLSKLLLHCNDHSAAWRPGRCDRT